MDMTVSSTKRKIIEMVKHGIDYRHKQPRLYAPDSTEGCRIVKQTDGLMNDEAKLLNDSLSDALLYVRDNASEDKGNSLKPISDITVEIKELPRKLELNKPEKSGLVPPLRSLEQIDVDESNLEDGTQALSVHIVSVKDNGKSLLEGRNDNNVELSKCSEETRSVDLQTYIVEGNESVKMTGLTPTAKEIGTLRVLDAPDDSKLAKKLDEHVEYDICTAYTEEHKPRDAACDPFNELYLYWSNLCNFQNLSSEDGLKIQPSICQPVKKYDKFTSRKIVAHRTYPPGCGQIAFRVKNEGNGTSKKLFSSAVPKTKSELNVKTNTNFGSHKQKPYFPLKKKVGFSPGKPGRPIGADRRPTGLVKPKFSEAENYREKTVKYPGSGIKSSSTKLCKTAEKEKKEIIARQKVKRVLRMFQLLCRIFLQEEERSSCRDRGKHHRRIDNEAFQVLKENKMWLAEDRKWLGSVPGIRVGDEFRYRIELCLTGVHPPPMAGISFKKINGENVATSIVSSGGYNDIFDSSDFLVYEGEGGHPGYQKHRKNTPGDQKLARGNAALVNSIAAKTPVRVIHGFREQISSQNGKGKVLATYVYDGLYNVEHYWSETNSKGFSVFKFRLKRMPNQEPLPQKEILMVKQKKTIRIGLCMEDISEGKESKAIAAVNTIDKQLPASFIYRAAMKYPTWYKRTPQKGCNCIGICSDEKACACTAKNGGEFPYNYDGAIVRTKPLVYECGPRCSCSPSCYNRVSQHGIKLQLEVFKTKSRGWGVRSLASIPSGGFVCEYIGEILTESEAQKRTNDEFLFQIGHNYDESLLGDLSDCMPKLQDDPYDDMGDTGFTIDAFKYGNIARFINHSCSPNLYAQNVLYDHDDKKAPHIMLFAVENIPPLTELCYHYNCNIGEVHDIYGNVKEKACYCGSPQCTGRLY